MSCNINNIKDKSSAFVNRLDAIVLENQLDTVNDTQLGELISNIYIYFLWNNSSKNKKI